MLSLARRAKFEELYGLDVSQAVVTRPAADLRLGIGDLNEALPYADNYFDAVAAIEHSGGQSNWRCQTACGVRGGSMFFLVDCR